MKHQLKKDVDLTSGNIILWKLKEQEKKPNVVKKKPDVKSSIRYMTVYISSCFLYVFVDRSSCTQNFHYDLTGHESKLNGSEILLYR